MPIGDEAFLGVWELTQANADNLVGAGERVSTALTGLQRLKLKELYLGC